MYPKCVNVLGNGCVVHIQSMLDELKQLDRDGIDYHGRLIISDRAQLVTQLQIESDISNETDPKSIFFVILFKFLSLSFKILLSNLSLF